jgi:hypothetical protein
MPDTHAFRQRGDLQYFLKKAFQILCRKRRKTAFKARRHHGYSENWLPLLSVSVQLRHTSD